MMFTGLIREIGVVRRLTRRGLVVAAGQTAAAANIGDSLAVDGICLTVTRVERDLICMDPAAETRRITTLASWRIGRRVHLEPALRVGQALDGHLVLGHVDGVGRVTGVRRAGASRFLTVHCGPDLARWLLPKGSVAVDGVSLTVDEGPHDASFTVNLVPHTLQQTTFAAARSGRQVNLEMDMLVKAARPHDATQPAVTLTSILARGWGAK
jgi:riboflavin synthase